ncbi:unnamed protein product [marine sediment metagenome]|uniref:Uncharacterized protein n=1 Tax=marine sediment metagenome TaxID=412755 RepID=X0UIZ5_9ZZZZ
MAKGDIRTLKEQLEESRKDALEYMVKYDNAMIDLQETHVKFAELISRYRELENYSRGWKSEAKRLIEEMEKIKAINYRAN